jgi:hypothetical protein
MECNNAIDLQSIDAVPKKRAFTILTMQCCWLVDMLHPLRSFSYGTYFQDGEVVYTTASILDGSTIHTYLQPPVGRIVQLIGR